MGDSNIELSAMEVEMGSAKSEMLLEGMIKSDAENEATADFAPAQMNQQTTARTFPGRRLKNQFQTKAQQNQEGTYRFRNRRFGQQRYRQKTWNFKQRSDSEQTGDSLKGAGSLNRRVSTSQMETSNTIPAVTINQLRGQRRPYQKQRRFQNVSATQTRIPGNNTGARLQRQQAQRQQRQIEMNLSREFLQDDGKKRVQARTGSKRWQRQTAPASTLMVSVQNPQASQRKIPQYKGPRGPVSANTYDTARQPKGVWLKFNFRAMANQTKVTLNERFSSLKIRGSTTAPRRGMRTVTLA
ncbi:UAP56-interacting factor-like [Protopterus annectens]|uniref:UAP56-interacting factor-like n=1 Tax=Protopterus annectens TaxID=7888 RepID=UPI001CFB42F0|nr:UAP56-interacting factor-like [Protopterus annectens]